MTAFTIHNVETAPEACRLSSIAAAQCSSALELCSRATPAL